MTNSADDKDDGSLPSGERYWKRRAEKAEGELVVVTKQRDGAHLDFEQCTRLLDEARRSPIAATGETPRSDISDLPAMLRDKDQIVIGGLLYCAPVMRHAADRIDQLDRELAYANSRHEAELKADRAVTSALSATRATPVEETDDSVGDWQCRDYGDGWITFPDRKAAEKYQEQTGAMMRYRRFYPANA